MTFERRTLKAATELSGRGLHSGVPVNVRIHPGSDGIRLRYGGSVVLALPENVTDTTRSTKVGEVGTVEHLMSAIAGLEITDVDIEVDAPEMPGLDGSASPYVEAFRNAGLESLGTRELPELFKRVFVQEDAIKIAVSKGSGQWRFDYLTGDRWPHVQVFETTDVLRDYASEVAPSRTFALAEEVPMLIERSLGQGLDESSALILGIEGYKNDARFEDEPARHKLLDLIGDLYLSGVPIKSLNANAERSGHRTNVKAAALIRQAVYGG